MKRRSLLLGGLAGIAGLTWIARPTDNGSNHLPFFNQVSGALDKADIGQPTLVIDQDKVRANIRTLLSHTGGRFEYRIVAKSLPSLPLLDLVMQESGSKRLMLFHQPFINQVVERFPDTDILLGKPMPVSAVQNFYREFKGRAFNPAKQLRWLVDTPRRVQQYAALAAGLNTTLQLCFELDVGLHRGGVQSNAELALMLRNIAASSHLRFAGFMGYEPHIVKVPGDAQTYRDKAMSTYSNYIEVARQQLGTNWTDDLLLNAGGSPTYQMYNEGNYPFNELAAGSCLVKPSDFDLASLADHQPASWIAAPVLKSSDSLAIPGINLGPLQSLWDPNRARSFFTYGGYWKATPVSPAGLKNNSLYGRSTNQEMYNGSANIHLKPDDWIFLRPTQSEFVFLQFGDIAVYSNGEITDRWPVFHA